VVRIQFGPFCFYVLNSPSVIRQALVGEARKLGKGLNFGRAKRLIGNADYSRSDMRATFFPFGQGIRNCIGEGFAWTESTLLLSAIAARWQLRLADGADVRE
jgi:hypothetical protein